MSFRSKAGTTWGKYHVNMKFENNRDYDKLHNDDVYMKAFLNHLSLRESCTDCKFKKKNRLSDITLADFWGIQNVKPDMNDGKGTSLVIVNSNKGSELFGSVMGEMICEEVDFELAIKGNPSFNNTSSANKNADVFFSEINSENFEGVVGKYEVKSSLIGRVKRKIKKLIKGK